jgi:DnaJ-class molecular chaperone
MTRRKSQPKKLRGSMATLPKTHDHDHGACMKCGGTGIDPAVQNLPCDRCLGTGEETCFGDCS